MVSLIPSIFYFNALIYVSQKKKNPSGLSSTYNTMNWVDHTQRKVLLMVLEAGESKIMTSAWSPGEGPLSGT